MPEFGELEISPAEGVFGLVELGHPDGYFVQGAFEVVYLLLRASETVLLYAVKRLCPYFGLYELCLEEPFVYL